MERAAPRASTPLKRLELDEERLVGFRFAVNVAVATAIVWTILRFIERSNPIWAIASMVAASDPQPSEARRMFKSRLVNVAVGSAMGLVFLIVGGARDWILPLALATTVLVSSYVVRVKTMWRQAPITAAIVIASAIEHESSATGIVQGLHKIAEVVFGCLVGVAVSVMMSKVWLIHTSSVQQQGPRNGDAVTPI
jgi:uncharacterized membrane protein YccC